VSGQAPVGGHYGPAVVEDLDFVGAEGEHRLDRQAEPGLQLSAAERGREVGHLRLFVHLGTDAVPDEGTHHPVPVLFGDAFDRGRDIADPIARDGRSDPLEHRLAGRLDE
jgi:hypothetical protein